MILGCWQWWGWSSIIIYLEGIIFNNNNNHLKPWDTPFQRREQLPRRGLLPPILGGTSNLVILRTPALPTPRYPALRRQDTSYTWTLVDRCYQLWRHPEDVYIELVCLPMFGTDLKGEKPQNDMQQKIRNSSIRSPRTKEKSQIPRRTSNMSQTSWDSWPTTHVRVYKLSMYIYIYIYK